MVSPGKPSPGKSVPALSNERVSQLRREHNLVDPTQYLTGELHRPNMEEINEQDPAQTKRLLDAATLMIRSRAKVHAWGVEHIPSNGVYICAATHVTQFDVFIPMMTMFHLGRRPRFMAKEELSHWPFVGWALKHVGMQSVPRRKGMARAIEEESIKILTQGRPLTIWPEGTVSRDPQKWPMSLKRGMAEIALIASRNLGYAIPIFPSVTWGAASINHFWPWPRKNVVLAFDDAVNYSDLLVDSDSWKEGQPPDDAVAELTERVRRRMESVMADIRGEEPPAAGMWDYRTMSRVPRPEIRG
ncbi:MAG: 1-acyl-sn-glycerol-3-phosphate acyltransferase [Bifidobacteriaceae bacterium]|jgi:1-acyl-sn-glycerol-3-phosphate acyltransferase|nr:1-acyl-sn-glycerol-3-phosphate acyltransferase [Bifidobacteriaceae bacterium]MCI1914292.1 1-acyl-sn-glycerol-3-phosphate acyltransferase [Bifidobacteriaceae bacterium]